MTNMTRFFTLACLSICCVALAEDRPYLDGAWLYTQGLGWNKSMHELELQAMRAIGMNTIVAGVSVECGHTGVDTDPRPCTPPVLYDDYSTCRSFYPTKLPWIARGQSDNNLALILEVADVQGMDVHLGVVDAAQFYSSKGQTAEYLSSLSNKSAAVASELYALFGHHNSLKGI